MPSYPWLFSRTLDISTTPAKINGMRTLGVPYAEGFETTANEDLKAQAEAISQRIVSELPELDASDALKMQDKEIIALIAYLQRLGTDIKK